MKKLILLALGIVLLAGCHCFLQPCYGGQQDGNYFQSQLKSWTWQDTALVTIGEALTGLDMGQTRYIALHPGQYSETNAILGKHPAPQAVTGYFLGVAALLPIVHYLVPEKYRSIAAGVYIGVEAAATSSNYRVGIKTSF